MPVPRAPCTIMIDDYFEMLVVEVFVIFGEFT